MTNTLWAATPGNVPVGPVALFSVAVNSSHHAGGVHLPAADNAADTFRVVVDFPGCSVQFLTVCRIVSPYSVTCYRLDSVIKMCWKDASTNVWEILDYIVIYIVGWAGTYSAVVGFLQKLSGYYGVFFCINLGGNEMCGFCLSDSTLLRRTIGGACPGYGGPSGRNGSG